MIARTFLLPLLFLTSCALAMQQPASATQGASLDQVPDWIATHVQSLQLDPEATLLIKYELNKQIIARALAQRNNPDPENITPLPERFRAYDASSLVLFHKEIARKIREISDLHTYNDTVNQLIKTAHELAHQEIESLKTSTPCLPCCQNASSNQKCTECKLAELMQEYQECELPLDQRYVFDVCAIL